MVSIGLAYNKLNRTRQHWYMRWYSTGSGSDRAPTACGGTVPGAVATGRPPKRTLRKAPGRYRSRYCTNVAWPDLDEKERALDRLAHSLPLLSAASERKREAQAHGSIGAIYILLGDPSKRRRQELT